MGKLIVLEGLDGSGKGTQSRYLADNLQKAGKKVRLIDFPKYGSDGASLVELYLQGGLGGKPEDTGAYAASMFFAADRYVSYRQDWHKDREDPDTILIANRYTTANAYHQLSKMERKNWDAFLDWLWDFEYVRLGLPAPDRVILVDVPQSVSDANVEKRSRETGVHKDIHEKDREYLARCREAALYVAHTCGWTVISCADEAGAQYPVEIIGGAVAAALSDLIS
ncbi:MAG: thymidylate kinase [Clostridia bacterium]|nr:thymidylate kinase [Clostridia bacterium]